MFFRKPKSALESNFDIEITFIPSVEIELTPDEIYAWNSLVYSAEQKNLPTRLTTKYNRQEDFSLREIEYAIWMIRSGNSSGISNTIASDFRDKLENAFISFYK